jgi:hypothetical protein
VVPDGPVLICDQPADQPGAGAQADQPRRAHPPLRDGLGAGQRQEAADLRRAVRLFRTFPGQRRIQRIQLRHDPLTPAEHDAAVAALRERAAGRADLLAEVAGIYEGTAEGDPYGPVLRQAAQLTRAAGADPAAVPARIEQGKRTVATSGPFPGGLQVLVRIAYTPAGGVSSRLYLVSYSVPTQGLPDTAPSRLEGHAWQFHGGRDFLRMLCLAGRLPMVSAAGVVQENRQLEDVLIEVAGCARRGPEAV